MNDPFFSIVIPAYNRGEMLPVALGSVLGQTEESWEAIVVDDGSTDNTRDVMKNFGDPRIRYHYQENKERSAARNKGISISSGSFICFLDSDDYYLPNHLAALKEEIEKHNRQKALYYTGAFTEINGERKPQPQYLDPAIHPARHVFYSFLLMNSVCIHRDIFKEDKFDESMNIWEDVHLWLRILLKYPLYQASEFTSVAVDHPQRGGRTYFEDPSIDKTIQYVRNIEDVFSKAPLYSVISTEEKVKKIIDRLFTKAMLCVWQNSFRNALTCIRLIVGYDPRFLLTKRFVSFNRELLASSIKSLRK